MPSNDIPGQQTTILTAHGILSKLQIKNKTDESWMLKYADDVITHEQRGINLTDLIKTNETKMNKWEILSNDITCSYKYLPHIFDINQT